MTINVDLEINTKESVLLNTLSFWKRTWEDKVSKDMK